ncbi:serine/arginine-rich splicing factor 10-like [Asterias rubens]|uniref:serine/arginine-rich splicing factor 10-like n=1 Tax=Asterias rubens TaxID=7604 RepID=UPI001454ECC5|nr:serine/arginine-rich splicing factor 10-like [Asterias rubens]
MSRRRLSRAPNSSLFVRNVHPDTREDDLRKIFGKYGEISDVYIPLDYYTKEPRGFSYIQYEDERDAEDALYYSDGVRLLGRELEVKYSEGDRKTPDQLRRQAYRGRDRGRRRSRSRSPYRRHSARSRSRSRSCSPQIHNRRHHSRSRPTRSKSRSRSSSPDSRRRSRSRSRSQTRR